MAQYVFAFATHRFLLDRVSGLRFPDTAVCPRFSPLRTSRQTGGHAFTSAPEGQGLHLHGDEVTRLKVNLNLVVCPEAFASFRPTGRTTYSSGMVLTAAGLSRRAAAASSADCRSGRSMSLRSTNSEAPVSARRMRSAADRSSRSNHSSGRRTLRRIRAHRRRCTL